NIILDKLIFREMIQHDCTAENLFAELKMLVENESYRSRMIADYNQVRTILGGSGASEKIAEAMIEALSK
ncbi:MAG: lipid-A-disaccharide synthase, partial [Bacteroidales bacterium]|nr:lipid-A-disaccharide synthase [Bacteroidales bacterium]